MEKKCIFNRRIFRNGFQVPFNKILIREECIYEIVYYPNWNMDAYILIHEYATT